MISIFSCMRRGVVEMVLSLVKGQKVDLTKNNPELNLLHIS
jgi:hypothetical protein